MKPVILLQTDFSLTWGAVASMKGVIKLVDPTLEIQDLCHEIKAYDPWEASLSLAAVEPYWPKGTVFVSVVDPGVGTDRKGCAALLKDGSIVVTPDNGTLTHLKHSPGIQEVREIDESINRFQGNEQVSVFHGRDIFGYCAARLATGVISFAEVGPEYSVDEVRECEEYSMKPEFSGTSANGFIMTGLSHFGGIQLNITNAEWQALGYKTGDEVRISFRRNGSEVFNHTVKYVPSFGYVAKGEPLLYCGSSGYLSIDCNQANFMKKYSIGTGKEWTVHLEKESEI